MGVVGIGHKDGMNVNKCSRDIRIAEETFWKRGEESINVEEDLYTDSLRQLCILYHLVHYRLDRPLAEEKYWPEFLKLLIEDLDSALFAQKIPESWLKAFLPVRKSAKERIADKLYTSSLQPLLAAASEEIDKVLKNLREIESRADKFWSPYRKRRYIRSKLSALSPWALRRSLEVYNVLNLRDNKGSKRGGNSV